MKQEEKLRRFFPGEIVDAQFFVKLSLFYPLKLVAWVCPAAISSKDQKSNIWLKY